MNTKKFLVAASAVVLAGSLMAGTVFADNDHDNGKGNDDHERAVSLGSTLEVHISDNGNVLVRGAKVTAVSGSTVTANTSWGATALTWTVNTDSNTQFVHRFGGQSALASVAVGDFVSFQGPLSSTNTGLTVMAKVFKNWSAASMNTQIPRVLEGKIKSIASTVAPTTMVVEIGNVDYTVSVAANISVLNNLWLTTSLANLRVGDHIRVYGVVSGTTITASVVRDTSIQI